MFLYESGLPGRGVASARRAERLSALRTKLRATIALACRGQRDLRGCTSGGRGRRLLLLHCRVLSWPARFPGRHAARARHLSPQTRVSRGKQHGGRAGYGCGGRGGTGAPCGAQSARCASSRPWRWQCRLAALCLTTGVPAPDRFGAVRLRAPPTCRRDLFQRCLHVTRVGAGQAVGGGAPSCEGGGTFRILR